MKLVQPVRTCLLIVSCCFVISAVWLLSSNDAPRSNEWPGLASEMNGKPVVPGPKTCCPPLVRNAGFAERISFIDVSGEECLPWRRVCGIESTARTNPDLDIFVYLHDSPKNVGEKPTAFQRPSGVPHCRASAILNQFANIKVNRSDLRNYLETFRWEGPASPVGVHGSKEELSAALKLVLLYQYGGLHLDADIISYQPLHCLKNALGIYEFGSSNTYGADAFDCNQILSFEAKHPFVGWAMQTLFGNYGKGKHRMSLKRLDLTKLFKIFCNVTTEDELIKLGVYRCHRQGRINLIDLRRFYPIPAHLNMEYFQERDQLSKQVWPTDSSYLAFIGNSDWGIPVPTSSLYASLAQSYCPSTWNVVQDDVQSGHIA